MNGKEKVTYPSIPVSSWWTIRSKFINSIPREVNLSYLATILGIEERSAGANVLPALTAFRIVDQDGKPTERANQWRDDEQYPLVCKQIREEIYPQELLDALPPPSPNREAVERWFLNKTGVGKPAAKKMASVYSLLCEANPVGRQETVPTTRKAKQPASKAVVDTRPKRTGKEIVQPKESEIAVSRRVPSLHIDIQIHISSDASANQIDQIFASMAKHLGPLKNYDDEQIG